MGFIGVLVMAILLEALVNALKPIWSADVRDEEGLIAFYSALVGGVLLAVLGGIDIFEPAGVPLDQFPILAPWVSFVFTGVVISRGANVVADLLQRLRELLDSNVG